MIESISQSMEEMKTSIITLICQEFYFSQEVLVLSPCCIAFKVIFPELFLQSWVVKSTSQLLQNCPQDFCPLHLCTLPSGPCPKGHPILGEHTQG